MQYKASIVKYCEIVGIIRTAYDYETKLTDNNEINSKRYDVTDKIFIKGRDKYDGKP